MDEATKLKSLYYCNLENKDRKKDILFGYCNGETDDVTDIEIFPFPVDSAKCYYEKKNLSDGLKTIYWKFSRVKPLIFDVICLVLISRNRQMVYSCSELPSGEDLFSVKLTPNYEMITTRSMSVSQTIMNVFDVGEIINRVKHSERNEDAFTNAARKFIGAALFTPVSGEMSNEEFLEKYDQLIFV